MSASRIVSVEGRGLPLVGDDIDTDRIMPARHLRAITFDGLEQHLFGDDRAHAARDGRTHPVDDPRFAGASLMVVNSNFGCGSSREHAPQGIVRSGIRGIIGESFSEIFFGNSVVMGLPCPTASADTMAALQTAVEQDPSTEMVVDLSTMRVTAAGQSYELSMPPAAREAFLDGSWDATGLLLENYDEVRAVASRLPYVTSF